MAFWMARIPDSRKITARAKIFVRKKAALLLLIVLCCIWLFAEEIRGLFEALFSLFLERSYA